LRDICPFTAIGIFNRGITDNNRKVIAQAFAQFLGVTEPVPETFAGIPVLNNQKSWFFAYDKDRKPEDIPALWNVFEKALMVPESDDADIQTDFMEAYTAASRVANVGWNLTMGLYWIRPWSFAPLDSRSQFYMTRKLALPIGKNGPMGRCSAEDYLAVLETLETRFKEEEYPVHSFPELSLAAWLYKDDSGAGTIQQGLPQPLPEDADNEPEAALIEPPMVPYSLDDVIADGCFLSRIRLESIMNSLRTKKHLILQGPPGTGKTWLAKRLGFALIGQKDEGRLRAVQFHPNLSYGDFIRGFRPNGQGRLDLIDGPFMEMIAAAAKEPDANHVIVIEEINRGNPAQIFGEMLTLLEADKRTPAEALELCYRRFTGERVSIPSNLYVIGTMNIADRSLALVDIAFRRRFAFIDLEPTFGSPWRSWVNEKFKIDIALLENIEARILSLNATIEGDASLGRQFRIGHSFVIPTNINDLKDPRDWFRQVVETQIGPLLEEYWFDDLDKARKSRDTLL
jgi:5-methylcytosine-specific restriction enzyme B